MSFFFASIPYWKKSDPTSAENRVPLNKECLQNFISWRQGVGGGKIEVVSKVKK